jgi:Homing endonuclease associated repeat
VGTEYPTWPTVGDVRAHFQRWPQALTAAGLRPHRRPCTREQIIGALRAWAATHGRPPHHDEWQRSNAEHPPGSTVTLRFGRWTAALEAAGLPSIRHDWTSQEILEGLRAFERAHSRPPTTLDLRDTRGTSYPPGSAVQRTFGSHRKALEQLGLSAGWTAVTDGEILDALRAYEREHGALPTRATWRAEHRRPGASTMIRRYGSWSAALVAARKR